MIAGGSTSRRVFRRRGALDQHALHFGPNMTPMVDVVMVILVFFMVSAAFAGPEWFLRMLLPQSAAAGAKQPGTGPGSAGELGPLRITLQMRVDPADPTRVLVSGNALTDASPEAVGESLKKLTEGLAGEDIASKVEVVIAPARSVVYREVVRMHELVAAAGITRVGYSTN